TRRCSTPTAPTSAPCAPTCAPGSAHPPTRSPTCAPPATPGASRPSATQTPFTRPGADMSTIPKLIDTAEDLWPHDGAPDGTLDQLGLASNLLGANRAVSNFGGGNTSAKGTATDHTGREVPVMWVKGSGSDLATMGAEHFTGLKLDEVLPLFERDEMSDEDMVAYLSRCMLDPRMPRASIETLLHAFVPAPHVHHTHPDGIN